MAVTLASSEFLSLELPAGGSLSLALNFGSFKQPLRQQQPRAQETSPAAPVDSPGLSSLLSCRYSLGALAVACARARWAPRSGSRVRGAEARAAGGTGPASPRSGGCRTRGSRTPPRVLSLRAPARVRSEETGPAPARPPPAGTSSGAEGGSWLGAWLGARGASRGRRRSQSERRPEAPPAVPPPPPALLLQLFRDPGEQELGRCGGPHCRLGLVFPG